MLPMIACSSTGQLSQEGSCGWQRRIEPPAPAVRATMTGPRQPSTSPMPHAPSPAIRCSTDAGAWRQARARSARPAGTTRTTRRTAPRPAPRRRRPGCLPCCGASSRYGAHGRSTRRSNARPLARPARPVRPRRAPVPARPTPVADESIAHAGVLVVDLPQPADLRAPGRRPPPRVLAPPAP